MVYIWEIANVDAPLTRPGHPMYMQAQQQQSGMMMPMPMSPAAAPCYGSLGVGAGLGAGVGGQPFLWNNPPMVGPSIPPPPQGMASWCKCPPSCSHLACDLFFLFITFFPFRSPSDDG